jgi:hypothetical protein
MKQIPSIIGWLLIILAFGLYAYGLGYGIYESFQTRAPGTVLSFPEPLDIMISSIGAIFLTNLGAVLGISVTNPASALAARTLPLAKNIQRELIPPMNAREQIQYLTVLVFLAGLISCFIAWACKCFHSEPEKILAIIPQQGKMFLGVVSAYMAFILGKSN